jgi:hypothetical protein
VSLDVVIWYEIRISLTIKIREGGSVTQ